MNPREYWEFSFEKRDQPDVFEATNRCLEVIEKSGVSAQKALEIVECLDKAVKRSNYVATKVNKFKSFPLKWDEDGRVFDPTKEDLK